MHMVIEITFLTPIAIIMLVHSFIVKVTIHHLKYNMHESWTGCMHRKVL